MAQRNTWSLLLPRWKCLAEFVLIATSVNRLARGKASPLVLHSRRNPQVSCQQREAHSYQTIFRVRPPITQRTSAGKPLSPPSPYPSRRNTLNTRNSPRFLTETIWSESLPSWAHLALSPTANMSSTCTTVVITTPPSSINRKTHASTMHCTNPEANKHSVRCACHCLDACF